MVESLLESLGNFVGVCVGKILLALCSEPPIMHLCSGPPVVCALGIIFPCAFHQDVILKYIGVTINGGGTIGGSARLTVEVVVVIVTLFVRHETPAVFWFAFNRIMQFTIELKQTSNLAAANTVLTKVKVELLILLRVDALDVKNAGLRHIVHKVGHVATYLEPALFHSVIERVGILEIGEGRCEVATVRMRVVARLRIRIDTILLLE